MAAEGGRVKIGARDVSEIPAGRRNAPVHGAFVAISIEDNGAGIDALTLERIFEPFFTTKPVSKGTGLGLSQVHGFVKQSGGDIDVDSRVGEGTRFTLYLPRSARSAQPSIDVGAVTHPPKSSQLSILLVEDNEQVGQFAYSLLREVGHLATLASNAAEALRVLEERHAQFDMVFTDVVMPGIDGVALAREIRSRWPNLPVVLTSGGYSHILAQEGREFERLRKPYSIQELEAALARAMR